jgi:hypothetical protein
LIITSPADEGKLVLCRVGSSLTLSVILNTSTIIPKLSVQKMSNPPSSFREATPPPKRQVGKMFKKNYNNLYF